MSLSRLLTLLCALGFAGLSLAQDSASPSSQSVTPSSEAEHSNANASDFPKDWDKPGFWETIDGKPVQENWQFCEGEIRLVDPRGGSGSILSPPLPSRFELTWQWKIEAGCNTGLKYRVRQYGGRWLGVEYQIIDEPQDADRVLPSLGATASIYDLQGPRDDKPLQPAGQWNESKVIARDNRLEHFLNGQKVATVRTDTPSWDLKVALSKFYGLDHFGQPGEPTRIMLTDHGGRATYRNFHFTTLKVNESQSNNAGNESGDKQASGATVSTDGPFLGNAIRNSWADQDSIVIWTRTTSRPEMIQEGPRFKTLSKPEASKLSRLNDPEKLLTAQLPDGASLDKMFGACPGEAGEVRLTYFPEKQRKQAQTTDWIQTDAESDFTAQWKLTGLVPDRRYAAVVEARTVGGTQPTAVLRGAFRTAPKVNQPQSLDFCMTTCHDFLRRDDGLSGHKIYPSMTKIDPAFVIHAGDIEYYDKPDPWAMTRDLMRFKWARIFSLPSNRAFYQQTTSYFIKDDHDTLKNDCWPGQTYGSVSFEEGVQLFNEEQFPSRDPRYQTVRWGRDLQIWILEGRDYRSPNTMEDGPRKTILGSQQKQWLFDTLAMSDAKFKLIFSPTPIVGPDRPNKRDNHANTIFAYEGEELRQELSNQEGVIVFCGDRHWQYASVDEQTGLWEFGCGPGSEEHQLGWKKGDKRPVHQFLRVAGGFLSGHLTYEGDDQTNPVLTLHHRTVTGKEASEFRFGAP